MTPTRYGYHVTNAEKLKKYQESGKIFAPVFLFTDIDEAKKLRRRNNGRTIILKCPLSDRAFPDPSPRFKSAVMNQEPIPFDQIEEVTG